MRSFLSMRNRGMGRLAWLVVLVAAPLGLMGGQPAAAATTSSTPSSSEPYRACPAPTPGYLECEEIVEPAAYVEAKSALGQISPEEEGTGELGGWSPENLKSAYKLPAKGGKGETVAIVDAWNYPDAEANLKVYREHYKLYYNSTETACTRANECFQKINQKGESSKEETAAIYPKAEDAEEKKEAVGWSTEMSLDLDMVSAVCPECKLLLVEANNNFSGHDNALDIAEDEAATFKEGTKFPGTNVISNSWGSSGEYSSETEEDLYFDHPGIQIVFAGGDRGYGPKYPATSPYVISAGGTQLTKEKESSSGRKWSEEVWHNEPEVGDSTGSGCSAYELKPPWQTDKGCSMRTENDVSAVAYHLSAYDSYERTGEERWTPRTGTSASTPIIAGIDALATSATQLLGADAFYKKPSMLFDITKGSNGTCTPPAEDEYLCTAVVGDDGPTGEGTPDNVFESIASAAATGLPTKVEPKGATLNGIVNPNGVAAYYFWEYGTTKSYGERTSEASAGSGTKNVEESNAITGLTGSTQYHFRLVTLSSHGITYGLDQVFTTTASPPENIVPPVASPATPDQAVPESTTTGTWINSPTSYAYQWELCNATGGECKEISGATSSTYVPVEADVGLTLRVKVTAKNSGGSNSAFSTATNQAKATGQITEYSLSGRPEGIAAGPDGNLWFADPLTNEIGKITTSGVVTEYAVPKESYPDAIAAGPDGNLWFTDELSNKIGKITTSGTITEYSLPSGSEPIGITAGPDGNLWFTELGTTKIGKITTSGTVIEEYGPLRASPELITAGPDGNLWFTYYGTSPKAKVGKITTSGTVTEYTLLKEGGAKGITAGPAQENALWFVRQGISGTSASVGKITTSGTVTEYSLPEYSEPNAIVAGADGNLWFTESNTNKIGRVTPSGTITEYALPKESYPLRITSGPDDNLWFTDYSSRKIGKITP